MLAFDGQRDFDRKTARRSRAVKMLTCSIHYHLPLVLLTAACGLHCFVIVSIILFRKSDEMNCSIYWLILA